LVDVDFLRPKMLLHLTFLVRKHELPAHVDATIDATKDEDHFRCDISFSETHDASLEPLFLHLTKYS
jgi:hypothetical protein